MKIAPSFKLTLRSNTILKCLVCKFQVWMKLAKVLTMCLYKKHAINISKPNEWLQLLRFKKSGFHFNHENANGRCWKFSSNSCSWHLLADFFIRFRVVFKNKRCYWNDLFSRYITNARSLFLFLKDCKPNILRNIRNTRIEPNYVLLLPVQLPHVFYQNVWLFKKVSTRPTILHNNFKQKIQVFRNLFRGSTAVSFQWKYWEYWFGCLLDSV